MVTKLLKILHHQSKRSVLAKIHMVTKHSTFNLFVYSSSVLAKIHMVTKQVCFHDDYNGCSVLAKIHMVTKPDLSSN